MGVTRGKGLAAISGDHPWGGFGGGHLRLEIPLGPSLHLWVLTETSGGEILLRGEENIRLGGEACV